MPRITALTLQKRNRQRVNVHLDGEYAFGLARIVAAWLEVGQELSDEKIAQLKNEDSHEAAYQRALNFLSYRPRSEAEVRKNLQKNGESDEIINYVMERLHNANLLNDANFAQIWVENRSEMHPRSRRALAFELQQRGVDRQAIDEALEDFDDEELAYQAALKQARKLQGLDWPEFRQKMYAFLARRGFHYEASATAAQRVWAELSEDSTRPIPTDYDEEVDDG